MASTKLCAAAQRAQHGPHVASLASLRSQKLTPQQAFDVATYINTRPRPDFPAKSRDWPHGGKPPDADYHVLPTH